MVFIAENARSVVAVKQEESIQSWSIYQSRKSFLPFLFQLIFDIIMKEKTYSEMLYHEQRYAQNVPTIFSSLLGR